MEEQTLLSIVQELEPRLLETLSGIHITFDGNEAEASLSFFLFGPLGISSVDTENLPEGVTLSGWSCFPDRIRAVSLDEPMETQIWALRDSGLVGGLNASRFDLPAEAVRRGYAPTSWIIKTHTTTEQERLTWMQSLKR